MEEILCDESFAGIRLDAALSERTGLSRSAAQRLIEDGLVTLDGKPAKKNDRPAPGQRIAYRIPAPAPCEAQPQEIPLAILYEDADLLVINKPKGMVVHPAAGNRDGTLVNALLAHCGDELSGIGGVERPGIVHRIDKQTSGLLVVAKNDEAHRFLSDELKEHRVRRVYYAVALGHMKEPEGVIDAPIGRHPADRKKMAVIRDGGRARDAVTHYAVLTSYSSPLSADYLRLELETGRTHQIRVHLSSLGHPLLGDTVYGAGHTAFEKQNAALLDGQCLHAKELYFIHPRTGAEMHFESPLPDYFSAVLQKLR